MEAFEYAIKKDIRNNAIVREIDRSRQRELWRWTAVGAFFARRFVVSTASLGVGMLGMVAGRHVLRRIALQGTLDVDQLPVAPQWSIFVLFLLCFVLALAVVAWMLWPPMTVAQDPLVPSAVPDTVAKCAFASRLEARPTRLSSRAGIRCIRPSRACARA